jgi:putative flippase GtrA
MALDAAELYARVRQLLPELLKFGIVGGIGTVVDLGGAALLHGAYHVDPLGAKAASTSAATVITYVGSRFWTFKDRENQELKREAVLFIVLNVVGLLIAEVVVGLVTYVMGLHGQIEYNIASFLGTGFGTIFRYFAYKKWVFLAPSEYATAPAPRPFPNYSPWGAAPGFPAPPARPIPPTRPAPARGAGRATVAAPAFASAWEREPASDWDPALAPTMSWSVPAPQPVRGPQPQPVRGPQPFPVTQPAAVHAPGFPGAGYSAPARAPRSPAIAPSPARRSSGGGRHRKR